jgi:hypothetical protein
MRKVDGNWGNKEKWHEVYYVSKEAKQCMATNANMQKGLMAITNCGA